MPTPRLYAGQVVTADRWNTLVPTLVTQENDQIVTNSATYVDSEISFTPEPNAVYEYQLLISYSATTAAGMKWSWDAPGALMLSFTQLIDHPGTAGLSVGQTVVFRRPANATDRQAGGTDATSPPANFHSAYDMGTFSTDGTISAVTLRFAQVVATAAHQTILRGANQTRMLYKRIA
ncbi:MAG TPA: hypothetical protein VIQ30_03745 [Pseudonocardia sp.]